MSRQRPLLQRITFSFLLNFKRLLSESGFMMVRFDEASGTLSVAGVDVLQATIVKQELKLTWLSEEWAGWGELVNDPKFMELKQAAAEKLAKMAETVDKGKGKGVAA